MGVEGGEPQGGGKGVHEFYQFASLGTGGCTQEAEPVQGAYP